MAGNAPVIPQDARTRGCNKRDITARAKIRIIIAKPMEPTSAIPF
jgi:hypothetical protein